MNKKSSDKGESGGTPVKELRWMAEFLAFHGQHKKALEIYRALVDTLTKPKVAEDKESSRDAA